MEARRAGRPRDSRLDQRILEVATVLLGDLGYSGMSLESVAATAGTTVPALRRRYRNKEELVAAVITSLRVQEPPTTASTPRGHALAVLENFQENLRALPAMSVVGTLLVEEHRHPELIGLFRARLVQPRRLLMRQALQGGVDAGELAPGTDLEGLTNMLIGSFYAQHLQAGVIPVDWAARVLEAVWPAHRRQSPSP